MRPVLFSFLGFDVQTYGLSKVLAAWIGAVLLARAFDRRGLDRRFAFSLVLWATVWGFAGAKAYYLLEHWSTVTLHDLGGMGFTWYGGLIAGVSAALVMLRRWHLPLGAVAGAAAAPLSLAYAVGRIGCLISGDGTYGRPTTLPWGMTFPNGVVTTNVPVHPTPLYEALSALAIAGFLLWFGRRTTDPALFGWYLVLSGVARFLVEYLRTNAPLVLGLSQPQLWAALGAVLGAALVVMNRRGDRDLAAPSRSTHLSRLAADLGSLTESGVRR